MCNLLAGSLQTVHTLLDQFSQSTGGYYIYYDFDQNLVHFSRNIEAADDLFSVHKLICTLTEWRQGVNPHDVARLERTMDDLLSRKIQHYSINYRVLNREGRSSWVNSCGTAYCTESGRLAYILGQLTIGSPIQPSGSYSNLELKKESRKLLSTLAPGYLLLIGVDNLKTINMRDGRSFGDAVLADVAQVIRDEVRHQVPVYRINGDWFALNLPGFSAEQVSTLFDRVQDRVCGQCTISAGCVSYTDYHIADEHLPLQYAETALDRSKARGKGVLTFFTPEIYEKKLRQLELREALEASIQAGFEGFEVYFQPQFRAEKYTLYGAEALLRYRSAQLGVVSPSEMIPVLEQSGLICSTGLWVLRQALRACRRWRARIPQFHISVNMSYRQLEQASIEEDVLDLVRNSGVPGSALTIEVTESMELADYPHLNRLFRRWRKQGIEISVDDFGTGYSSLSRLKEMAIDEIKIDRCFVSGIQNSAYNYRLLNNILELAESNQVRACCEGVETLEELQVLQGLHCNLLQGYLFSHPCTAAEFERRFINEGAHSLPLPPAPPAAPAPGGAEPSDGEITQAILNAENDLFYLCDLETYQLYYLNAAGQRLFGVQDYKGKPCYKVLRGRDSPCPFCNNQLYQNTFSLWEQENPYCQRHFLLKDKILTYRGRKARLEVGLDITKQEYVSQAARERLNFAEKIVEGMNALSVCADYAEAVNRVLALMGDFYQADRAYLFEPSATRPNCWTNTYEWCAVNVSPQKQKLQQVGPHQLGRWLTLFDQDQSVILFGLDSLRAVSPQEWADLTDQDIQRLIAVPLRANGKTVGFLGVDNPRYCIHDDSQIRVLAGFLLTRMNQERNERRYRMLMQESNQDLLRSLKVGYWTLEMHKKDGRREMIVDPTMQELLAMPEFFSPCESYHFWASRVKNTAQPAVEQALGQMIETGQLVQIEFPWEHDRQGEIQLRLSGMMMEETPSLTRLNGYCRLLSGR